MPAHVTHCSTAFGPSCSGVGCICWCHHDENRADAIVVGRFEDESTREVVRLRILQALRDARDHEVKRQQEERR